MKVLVIPDVHLKPYMFEAASNLMKQGVADCAVCLMDLADDWNMQYQIQLYEETYDAAICFAKRWPQTRWCYGNHDICYLWNERESGYSSMAADTVCRKLNELSQALPEGNKISFIHRIDHVLFSHGGLSAWFVEEYVGKNLYEDADAVIETINEFGPDLMWNDWSPLWYRPQFVKPRMYRPRTFLQVVGHTPVESITKKYNIISCDNFSTYSDGRPIGKSEFLVVNTETWDYYGVK